MTARDWDADRRRNLAAAAVTYDHAAEQRREERQPKAFVAHYRGVCARCQRSIIPGQRVVRTNRNYHHVDCGPLYAERPFRQERATRTA